MAQTTHRFIPRDGQFWPGLPDRDLTSGDAVDGTALRLAVAAGIFEPATVTDAGGTLGAVYELAVDEDGNGTSRMVAAAGSPEAEAFLAAGGTIENPIDLAPAKAPPKPARAVKPAAAKPAARKAR